MDNYKGRCPINEKIRDSQINVVSGIETALLPFIYIITPLSGILSALRTN